MDVLAADDDHVVDTPEDAEVALVVDEAEVADADQVAGLVQGDVGVGVTGERGGVAQVDLADGAVGDLVAVLVEDLEVGAQGDRAGGGRVGGKFLGGGHGGQCQLGGAVDVAQDRAEAFDGVLDEGGGEGVAGGDDELELRGVVALVVLDLEDLLEEDRGGDHRLELVGVDVAEDLLGVEDAVADDRGAGGEGDVDRAPAPGVEDGGVHLDADVRPPRHLLQHAGEHERQLRLGAHDALGDAGGAGRHEHDRAVLRQHRQGDVLGDPGAVDDVAQGDVRGVLAGLVADDDVDALLLDDRRVQAVDELIVDDQDVDAVLLDAAGELLGGGGDVEEVDAGADVALGRQRVDDAAAVAGHDAEADVVEAQAGDVAGEGLGVLAELAVGDLALVVDDGDAVRGGQVALLDLAGGGEPVAAQCRSLAESAAGTEDAGAQHGGGELPEGAGGDGGVTESGGKGHGGRTPSAGFCTTIVSHG